MSPRTRPDGEFYYCVRHSQLGGEFCGRKEIRRDLVDTAVFRYFEQVGLDLEATRQQLASERDRRLAEVGALRQQAQQEAQRAAGRLARIKRDYMDGKLDAADWASFRDELTAEHEAAQAEADRLLDSEAEVERDGVLLDAGEEVLERLGEIRRAIAGEITDAGCVDAVRAALSRLFSAFVLHPQENPRYEGSGRAELVDVGHDLMIELVVHERALEGYDERLLPILRREALAGNNQSVGSATK